MDDRVPRREPTNSAQPNSGGEAQAKTAALLTGMWTRSHSLIDARLTLLERASEAALTGTLPEELRAEAMDIAHKLAGSLGMFGFAEGTRIARELETMLESGVPEAARFAEAAGQLRPMLFPEVRSLGANAALVSTRDVEAV